MTYSSNTASFAVTETVMPSSSGSLRVVLSKSGVVPRMAQELMRHSDIRLTMNVYTHLQLIDTASAVESLPSISLAQRNRAAAARA